MAEFPFLPIDVRAFMADTQHLDARETGAYGALLFHAWLSQDNGLPDDDKRLALLARCSRSEWAKIRSTVLSFWFLSRDGRWHQKRLDTTRMEVAKRSAQASAAANAKWLKWLETRRADADAYAKRTLPERIAPGSPPASAIINTNLESESDRKTSTDPAREPALGGGSGPRAKKPRVAEQVARLAELHRRKTIGSA